MKNKNFVIYFIVTIIFIITVSIISYINQTKNTYINVSKKILFQEASSLFENIVIMRTWASQHDGVYVKAHDDIKPNPHLKDNHLFSDKGELLIKINPAWMTRQLSELSNKKNSDYYFKITSLHPINNNNKADAFEERALRYLDKNKNERFYTNLNHNSYDLLGTLKIEESCLRCHDNNRYKIGDNLGGLRVSIPIERYSQNVEMITSKTDLLYIITFFTSIVFIFIISYTINTIYRRERNILRLNKTLEKKVKDRTKELLTANKQLLKISTIDFLTNIPNRRYFFEMGHKSISLAKRENEPLCVICIDIDFFKNVNDTYGHQVGDEVLKHVANSLTSSIRKSDIVARTGGEEFSIITPKTDLNGAYILAEKIRINLENNPYSHKNEKLKITLSLGVSQLIESDETVDSIIARADKALYLAKESGRNKTEKN